MIVNQRIEINIVTPTYCIALFRAHMDQLEPLVDKEIVENLVSQESWERLDHQDLLEIE